MNFLFDESTPTPTPKAQNLQILQLNINSSQKISQVHNIASPHGSELSFQSQAFYSKPTAFITKKELNQAINDLNKNIREGKYHRSILRMHKLLGNNSNIPFVPYQQIKLYRRYFECMRKLSKRYFSQVGMTKNQLSNLEKMCDRGTYILDNWYNILCDLIKDRDQIMLDDIEIVQEHDNNDKTNMMVSQKNIDKSQDLQSDRHVNTEAYPITTRRISLNRIKEVDDEESEPNSAISLNKHISIMSPIHNIEERLEIKNEKEQNKKILKNIDFHLNEFFKANFQIAHTWAQYAKKTEKYSLYQSSLFKATQWIQKLQDTKEEDLINNFAKTYVEIANYYIQQGSIKECIKNYEQALSYLQLEMQIRGSAQKHQKLMKMSSRNKRKQQNKLLHNILMIVSLLYNLSIAEELQENYSRVLETLNLAEWLATIYLQGAYHEIEDMIYKAAESARNKYKDMMIEEGEVNAIMGEALGLREEKRRIVENNIKEDNDFYNYYSKHLYEKFNVKELNESLYIIIPKRAEVSPKAQKPASSETVIGSLNSLANIQQSNGKNIQQNIKISKFHYNANLNQRSQVHKRNKKNLSIPASLNSINILGSTNNTSNLNTRYSFLDETPTKFKIEPLSGKSKVRNYNSVSSNSNKGNSMISVLNNTNTPISNNQNQSMVSLTNPKLQRSSFSHSNNNQNVSVSNTSTSSPYQQYLFVPLENQQQLQTENNTTKSEILKNLELTQSPIQKRERYLMSGRSHTTMGIMSPIPLMKNISSKQESSKKLITKPQIYQPQLLTTDKYFNEASMLYYSSSTNNDIFQDKEKTEEQKMQEFRNRMLKPQVIQNLDHYFKEKIDEEFDKKNKSDQCNMNYDFVTSGIIRVMKDESFDQDEFENAFKLLKLKKQKQQLRQGEEVFDKQEPNEAKIKTNNQIQNEIYYQEINYNLKQQLSDRIQTQKELQNQRMAQNLIKEDFADEKVSNRNSIKHILTSQRNSMISLKTYKEGSVKTGTNDQKINQATQALKAKMAQQKYEKDKQAGLTPQQLAKRVINSQIEQVDLLMMREKKEMNELMLPLNRRILSQQQKDKEQTQITPRQDKQEIENTHSPLIKKSNYNLNRQNSKNRRLRFLDQYQEMSESTQLLTVKRDQKKATSFVDLAFASFKLSKAGGEKGKLSETDSNIGVTLKEPSPASKIQQTIQKSLRKLMKLKTTDLQEGSTPISQNKLSAQQNELVFSKFVK